MSEALLTEPKMGKFGRKRYLVLVALFFISAIEPAAQQRLAQISAFIAPDLHYTVEQVGMINVSGNVGQVPAFLIGGILAARFGPKRFLVIAGSGLLVIPFAMAFANGFVMMYSLSVLIGACSGLIIPAGVLIIARWFPVRAVAGPMAIFFSSLMIAAVVINPLNLLIAEALGWRWVYIIMSAPAVVSLILVILVVKGRPAEDKTISAAELKYITEDQIEDVGNRTGGVRATLQSVAHPRTIVLILALAIASGASAQLNWVWFADLGTVKVTAGALGLVTSTGFLLSGGYSFIHGGVVNRIFRGNLNAAIFTGTVIGFVAYLLMITVFPSMWVIWTLLIVFPVVLMIPMVTGSSTAYIAATAGPAASSAATGFISAIGGILGFILVSVSGSWINPSLGGLAAFNPIWIVNMFLIAPLLVIPWAIKKVNVLKPGNLQAVDPLASAKVESA